MIIHKLQAKIYIFTEEIMQEILVKLSLMIEQICLPKILVLKYTK